MRLHLPLIPVRRTLFATLLASMALMLVLVGKPEAPPEAEAFATVFEVTASSTEPRATGVTLTYTLTLDVAIPAAGFIKIRSTVAILPGGGIGPVFGVLPASGTASAGIEYVKSSDSVAEIKGAGSGEIAVGTHTLALAGFTNPVAGVYTFDVIDQFNGTGGGPMLSDTLTIEAPAPAPAPSVTVAKTVAGMDGSFSFTASGSSDSIPALLNGESHTFTDVTTNSATVTIIETVTPGYTLTGIACTGVTNSTIVIGRSVGNGGSVGFDAGDDRVAVTTASDEDVTCTFTNTELGSITIVKDTDPDADQDFTFTAGNSGGTDVSPQSPFTLDDANPDDMDGVVVQ